MADVYVLMCNNKPKVRVFEKPPAPPINILLWLFASPEVLWSFYQEPFFYCIYFYFYFKNNNVHYLSKRSKYYDTIIFRYYSLFEMFNLVIVSVGYIVTSIGGTK